MTPQSGHTSLPRWGSGGWGSPFDTNNTKPTVKIPIVNMPTVNIQTVSIPTVIIPTVNIQTVNIPTVKTQKNNMRETQTADKKRYTLDTPFAQARWQILK